MHHTFLYIPLPSLHDCDEMPILVFFLNLSAVPKKPTWEHLPTFDIFTYLEKTWQNLKKTRIHFKSDVFPVVAVVDAEAPS